MNLTLLLLPLVCACSASREGPSLEVHRAASSSCPIPAYIGDAGAAKNALGDALEKCPSPQRTGFYRTGYCSTGPEDTGAHVVCARVTDPFLRYSLAQGNDLVTPRDGFSGLTAGDAWCLCASRWSEAVSAGVAPPVVLEATDESALRYVERSALEAHRAP